MFSHRSRWLFPQFCATNRLYASVVEIWINPACSKCRAAIELLDDAGADYVIRRYLDDPPTEAELREVAGRLGLQPWDITRHAEPLAAELGMWDWPRDPDLWFQALAEHPVLIQRPIITAGEKAVVGRTEEAVRSVL
jgi:arsenate reductase (glutaredoxin)